MVKQHFSHVRHWVFDLDNTLYSPAVRLFDQIERRMTDFVMRVTGHADRSPALRDPMAVRNDRVEITLLRRGAGGGPRK